jgi:small-conductance mechanosensitive channel
MSARIVRVDLHEKRELDLAAQVARVRAGTRPWRSIIAFALAVLAAIASWAFPHYQLSGKARQLLRPLIGSAHAAVVRYTIVLAGSILILIVTLDLLQIAVGSLVLGGAVTTILLGIAAQQSLGNLFAGIVLLLSRPFAVGDSVEIRSGALGGPLQGTVTEIGITYVRLDTPDGVLHLPNSQILAAGVGQPSQRPSAQPSPDPQPPSLP